MKEELFDELLESVRQGGRHLRGSGRARRRWKIAEPDVAVDFPRFRGHGVYAAFNRDVS